MSLRQIGKTKNMTYSINQEEIERLKKVEGEVRGVVFKTDENYILREKGEEGLKKVEEELEKMGVFIDYKSIDRMDFYPLNLRVFSLLAISKAFNYGEEEIKEMGRNAPRASFLIKFFTKYFMSSQQTLAKVTEMWAKHYTKGRIEAVEVSEDEGRAVFRLHEVNLHPVFCRYLLGYFSSIVSMVVAEKVEAKETKCLFNNDDYHEFYLTWNTESNN